MKTDVELIRAFEGVMPRLLAHGIAVNSDSGFVLSLGDKILSRPETVDGLVCFADAFDFFAASLATATSAGLRDLSKGATDV